LAELSLAVPFATGGGTVVKAVSKADDIVDFSEDSRSGNRHSRLSSLRQPQGIWEFFLNYFVKAPQSAQKRHDLYTGAHKKVISEITIMASVRRGW
jgi:hypothetical protein